MKYVYDKDKQKMSGEFSREPECVEPQMPRRPCFNKKGGVYRINCAKSRDTTVRWCWWGQDNTM